MTKPAITRNQATEIRNAIFTTIMKKIRKDINIHPEFLKLFKKCYFIVKIKDVNNIEVLVVGDKPSLSPDAKRKTLQNNLMYARHSFYGELQYGNSKVMWKRANVKDSATYAEGAALLSFNIRDLGDELFPNEVKLAFIYYKK